MKLTPLMLEVLEQVVLQRLLDAFAIFAGRQDTLLHAQGHENGAAPTTEVLLLEGAQQEFVFTEVPERPVPSLLRGFSAPVKLEVREAIPGQPVDMRQRFCTNVTLWSHCWLAWLQTVRTKA